MPIPKLGLALNYPEGPNYYFKVSNMWRTLSKNGFMGFASNYHTGDMFRIWSKNNYYITGSVVCCRKILDVDCFIVDDHISEQICDLDDFLKEYQLNQYCIPIIKHNNSKQLNFLEEFENPKNELEDKDNSEQDSSLGKIDERDDDPFHGF